VEGARWWHVRAHRLCVVRSGESHRVDGALLGLLLSGGATLEELDLASAACACAESDAEAWRQAEKIGLIRRA